VIRLLRPLFPYLRRYRTGLLWGSLTVLISNCASAYSPQILSMAVNALRAGTTGKRILIFAAMIIAVSIVKNIFLFLCRWIIIGISRDIEVDLRNDLFLQLEKQSTHYFNTNRTGDIMARMTNDLKAVRELLGPAILYGANTLFFSIFAVYYMLRISPRLTLVALVPMPLASVLVQYFGRRIHERFEQIQAMYSDISAQTQENLSAVRLVRAYAQEEAQIRFFETANKEYIRRSLLLVQLMGMLWPSLEFVLGIAMFVTLLYGGHLVIDHQMNVGNFVAFNAYMLMLTWPIIAVGWVVNLVQRGTASVGRIQEILSHQPEMTDSDADPDIQPGHRIKGDIEFVHLNFDYGAAPVLCDINLSIPAGTSLALVGPTGSGKTTLASLIPRLYDAAEGCVLIDGIPVRRYPFSVLRSNIGVVPQETFLFSETLLENIRFGRPGASLEEAKTVAEAAQIRKEIEEFPNGFDTMVGERGVTLSGGQKQRTSIARALLTEPAILILDDALASVDTYTEERILEALRKQMQGRTTLLISHRVSTVRNADRIAVLDSGRIIEIGTHSELLEQGGYYAGLAQKQQLEEELTVLG